jgi:hypothetical protein
MDLPMIAPSLPPSTPPASSSFIATSASPAMSYSRISPAYYDSHPPPREDPPVYVKQEHQADSTIAYEAPDQIHTRKDSQYSSQGTFNAGPSEPLPGIHSFTQGPASTYVPEPTAYKPIFSPPVQHSPSMPSASSPKSPYGNDQQTVMMSPNVMLPPIQPRFSAAAMPAMLTSMFAATRQESRPNGSSPER